MIKFNKIKKRKYIWTILAITLILGTIGIALETPEDKAARAEERAEAAQVRERERAARAEERAKAAQIRERERAARAEERAKAAAEQAKIKAEEEAEERRRGFHCLSSWDGSHRAVVILVKDRLNDAASFEHIETRVAAVNSAGHHTFLMRFRARNGFGGLVQGVAKGSYNTDDCSDVAIAEIQ